MREQRRVCLLCFCFSLSCIVWFWLYIMGKSPGREPATNIYGGGGVFRSFRLPGSPLNVRVQF